MTFRTFSQDGGVGRYTSLFHTTKRRTTINFKTKNYQNCQKIELYGTLTTKKLKKKHSPRLRRGGDQQQGQRIHSKAEAGGLGSPTFMCG